MPKSKNLKPGKRRRRPSAGANHDPGGLARDGAGGRRRFQTALLTLVLMGVVSLLLMVQGPIGRSLLMARVITLATQQAATQQATTKDDDDDVHYSNQALLGLLDWEVTSLEGMKQLNQSLSPEETATVLEGSCQPPEGIDPVCCLGTYSAGGEVSTKHRNTGHCSQSYGQLDNLKASVNQFFINHPPVTSTQQSSTEEQTAPAMACDVCQIVELARRYNVTKIGFLGDSMHNQVFNGLSCELQRRNYNVTTESFIKHPLEKGSSWRRNFLTTTILHVTSPTWRRNEHGSSGSEQQAPDVVQIQLDLLYQIPVENYTYPLYRHVLETTDVLILGFGLHYKLEEYVKGQGNDRATYIDNMKSLLHDIHTNSNVQLLLHRETTATHFDAERGTYELYVQDRQNPDSPRGSDHCVPLGFEQPGIHSWREHALQEAIQQATATTTTTKSTPKLLTLPFYSLTHTLHDMHPTTNIRHRPDCCHYCTSPYLYMTLWRSIRLAMDEHYILHNTQNTVTSK